MDLPECKEGGTNMQKERQNRRIKKLPYFQVALCDVTNTEDKEELDALCCQLHLLFLTLVLTQDAALKHTHTQILSQQGRNNWFCVCLWKYNSVSHIMAVYLEDGEGRRDNSKL